MQQRQPAQRSGAAYKIHELGNGRSGRRPTFAYGTADRTRAVVLMDGLVAVGVYGAAQPLSDLPEGFLSSDALELASLL